MKNYLTLILIAIFFPLTHIAQGLEPDEKNALLNVAVTDFEDQPLEGEIVIFQAKSSGKAVKRKTKADGKFQIRLPKGETYQIKYVAFLDEKEYSEIAVPNDPGLMEATLQVQMESIENEVFELDIHFETAKAVIYKSSYNLLDDLVAFMKEKPKVEIEVAGHTDSDGSDTYNLQLSKDRAAAVRSYLIAKGVSGNRVKSLGYGESKPIASNATDEGKARNRRTEVRVTAQ